MLTTDFVFFKRCTFNILYCKIGICINFEYKGLFPFLFGHWTSSCACVSFFMLFQPQENCLPHFLLILTINMDLGVTFQRFVRHI